jgi:hypothetical protein
MPEMVHRVLTYRVSVAALIGVGLLIGFPYLLVGVLWSLNHTEHLHQMHGADLAVSFLGTAAGSFSSSALRSSESACWR